MKYNYIKSLILILVVSVKLLLGGGLIAQNYGDPKFYLVDSLDLDLIESKERVTLDAILELYHKRDLANDTLQFYYLEQLIEGFESPKIELFYRHLYFRKTQNIDFSQIKSNKVKKRLLYAKAYAYANIGISFIPKGHQDSTLLYLQKAIPLMNQTDSSGIKATLYNVAAYCSKNLGQLNQAINYNIKALSLAEASQDSTSMSSVYNNLAGLHDALENFDKANYYYKKAINYSIATGETNYAISLDLYGEYLCKHNDSITGLNYLLRSESLIDTSFSSRLAMNHGIYVYQALGSFYQGDGKLILSGTYFQKGLELAKQINSSIDKCRLYIGLAGNSFLIGKNRETLKYGFLASEIADKEQLNVERSQSHKVLYQVYLALNDSKKALKHFQIHVEEENLLRDEKNQKKILQKSYEYDFNRKKSIDSLKNQQKLDISETNEKIAEEKASRSKFQTYIAIGITILTLLFLYIIFSRLRIIRDQKRLLDKAYEQLEESKKNELAASNLKAIKSQMNPHFIFNSINSIQDLVLRQETLKSYDYLVVFSKLVRNILDFSEREFIPIDEETTFLATYLGLEKLRFSDDFEFTINSNLKSKGVLIPSLIVQPFAENAIKHGLLHKTGKKTLEITFSESENGIICTVVDNGIGQEEAKKIKSRQGSFHKSFSTEAIEKRLSLLQDQMNSKAGYEMKTIAHSDGHVAGTKVIIYLPIN